MDKLFSIKKLGVLSEITRDIGQVLFAGVFVGPILSQTYTTTTFVLGLMLSVCFWLLSMTIIKD